MTAQTLVASVAAAIAAALAFAPSSRGRRARPGVARPQDDRALLLRLRPVLAVLAFTGAWAFLGGVLGALGGVAAAVAAWRVLGHAESPTARRWREELDRDLPAAAHLIGACLVAGAPVAVALSTVAGAFPGAVADELRTVHRRLALGVDAVVVWRDLGRHPQLAPLGRALLRAHESGASVAGTIETLAEELASRSRSRTDARARSVEVRAAAPLGVCFLPAFVLLGVVPMVAGVFSAMSFFG
jgi:Flp pilus assembly protein TadB